MEVLVYKKEYNFSPNLDNFLDFYYGLQMNYLASDFLQKGLSVQQIQDAVLKAIKIGTSSGIKIRKHFMPVFTEVNGEIINDCNLSKLAYGLVLLNANPELSIVGAWQVSVLKKFWN
jgi:hypothetical protein